MDEFCLFPYDRVRLSEDLQKELEAFENSTDYYSPEQRETERNELSRRAHSYLQDLFYTERQRAQQEKAEMEARIRAEQGITAEDDARARAYTIMCLGGDPDSEYWDRFDTDDLDEWLALRHEPLI